MSCAFFHWVHGCMSDVQKEILPLILLQENNEFFVMTNMIMTPNQTRGKCPEDPRFKENHCKNDSDCEPGETVINGNGKY